MGVVYGLEPEVRRQLVHDNKASQWQVFTPVWSNVTVGTGGTPTSEGSFRYVDGDLQVRAHFRLGTSGMSVTSPFTLELPDNRTASGSLPSVGAAFLLDASLSVYWPASVYAGSDAGVITGNENNTFAGWAADDEFWLDIRVALDRSRR